MTETAAEARRPYLLCAIVGLGGLYFGVTGPLLSNFIPPMVRDVLGDRRTEIGAVLALDNVIMLLLVPWSGGLSDRRRARGRGRLPIILAGYVLSAVGMALLPSSAALGLAGLVAAMVVLYSGMNVLRAPFQALLADLVPSRYRSLANGSVTFQMCVGAIAFLMMGRALGMRSAFLIAAGTVLGIALALAMGVRESPGRVGDGGTGQAPRETSFRALLDAASAAVRGTVPGLRAIFAAVLLLQLTFQGFASWFALHGTERFGGRTEDMSVGFIAWAWAVWSGPFPPGGSARAWAGGAQCSWASVSWPDASSPSIESLGSRGPRCSWPWPRCAGRCRPSTPIRCSSSPSLTSAAASSPRSSCCAWPSEGRSATR
jgi:hypothetical protein